MIPSIETSGTSKEEKSCLCKMILWYTDPSKNTHNLIALALGFATMPNSTA